MTIAIGTWVRRKPRQKWHLIESVIANDAVTRCGRRLEDPFADTSEVEPLTRMIGQPQLCQACQR